VLKFWNINIKTLTTQCQYVKGNFDIPTFVQLGFNETDTFKSSSILIYRDTEHIIYTQMDRHDAAANEFNNLK
jgi:hypothetical protein